MKKRKEVLMLMVKRMVAFCMAALLLSFHYMLVVLAALAPNSQTITIMNSEGQSTSSTNLTPGNYKLKYEAVITSPPATSGTGEVTLSMGGYTTSTPVSYVLEGDIMTLTAVFDITVTPGQNPECAVNGTFAMSSYNYETGQSVNDEYELSQTATVTGKTYDIVLDIPDVTLPNPVTYNLTVDGANAVNNYDYRISFSGPESTVYASNAGSESSGTLPTTPGTYTATATVSKGQFNLGTATDTFTISKQERTGTISQDSFLENYGSVNPDYALLNGASGTLSAIEYKLQSEPATAYSTTQPTAAGQYDIRGIWAEDSTYSETIATSTFEIYKMFTSAGIQVPNITYGQTVSPVVTIDGAEPSAFNGVNYTITYKKAGADDSTYTETKPTAVGDYVARVVANCSIGGLTSPDVTATTTFSIEKREGSGSITVPNIRYGAGKVTPQVSSDRNGTNNVTITYKQQGAADSTYTSTVPTVPGKYTARAVFAATDTTKEYTATTNFEITKATGTAYVTASDIYYGGKLETTVSTTAANAGTPVLEYKLQGADNSTYTTTVPTAVGEYTIRATYPESAYYTAFSATYNFSITYMPAPTYTITGTKGTNDYFTSAVTITPEAGYQVATALDGEYASQVRVLSTKEVPLLYFRNAETGGKSDGVSTEDILIDASVPLISNTPEEDELFEDNWYFTVSDLNLFKIFINGEPVDFTGSSAQITFDAEGGRKEYHIEIVDRAGNVTEYDFVLSAKWLQEGIIPVGEPVMLEPDTPYTLSEGESVTIEGDSTSYAGGMTVYVREAGQFTFN
ncbi:MAG: hypothetical protein ACI4DU_11350 [Lachnospiraceae bacterium]